ncbi:MAG: mechanosensitive ion channel family protein [Solirubrobacteraceae bacterium]|nr:mechanosensitive ion channel family protein [Solirubrobacteraceae bacterium]
MALTTILGSISPTVAPVLGEALSAEQVAARGRRLDRVCGEAGSWQSDLCRSIYDGAPTATGNRFAAEAVHWLVTDGLGILVILVVAWIVNRLVRRCIVNIGRGVGTGRLSQGFSVVRRIAPAALLDTQEVSVRSEQRREAVLGILKSVATALIYATAVFMALGRMSIDLAPLLAGAGVLGVALGFGAQSLVGDFLSGVFILLEDQFGVGDEIQFRPVSGGDPVTAVVEALTLRNTRLRALDGTVWHVPNGEMRAVGNQSQHWSRSVLDVPVAHGQDISAAKAAIGRAAEAVRENDAAVLEPPEVWGVQSIGPNGVTIRLVIKTTPSQQWRIMRLLREQIYVVFAQDGIEMPVSDRPFGGELSPM